MDDPFDLQRFVDAQEPVFERASQELRQGRKTSHWMWFIFPQIGGLGQSETSRRFAIASRVEAEAYLRHPILGPRLIECSRLVARLQCHTAEQIFGYPDDRKLQSCMTLFAAAAPDNPVFQDVLDQYFAGRPDPATLRLL